MADGQIDVDLEDDPWGRSRFYLTDRKTTTLSNGQHIALCLLPILPCLLSLAASISLLFVIWKERKASRNRSLTVYQRILFMFSVTDIFASINYLVGPFLLPRESSLRHWALGSRHTCTISGAFSQFGYSSFLYYGVLSTYFLLTIRFGTREVTMQRYWEPAFHALAFGYPLVTSVVGLFLRIYSEIDMGRGCWVNTPCDADNICTQNPPIYAILFGAVPILMMIIVTIVNNLLIYLHVRGTIYRSLRRANRNHNGGGSSSSNRLTPAQRRVRAVAKQAFLYVGGCVGSYFFPTMTRLIDAGPASAQDEADWFWLLAINAVLLPMVGVWNCLVYVAPTYERVRRDYAQQTRFWALRRSLWGDSVKPVPRPQSSTQGSSRTRSSTPRWNQNSSTTAQKTAQQEDPTNEVSSSAEDAVAIAATNMPLPLAIKEIHEEDTAQADAGESSNKDTAAIAATNMSLPLTLKEIHEDEMAQDDDVESNNEAAVTIAATNMPLPLALKEIQEDDMAQDNTVESNNDDENQCIAQSSPMN